MKHLHAPILFVIFAFFFNTNVLEKTKPTNTLVMQDPTILKIQKWQKLIQTSLTEIKKMGAKIEEGLKYEKLENTTCAKLPKYPFHYFHFGKNSKCVILYIGQNALSDISIQSIEKEYGKADTIARSRAGKLANQYIYSSKGFAFSELDGVVAFFEVFPCCSLKEYKEQIYIEPPIFTH